MKQHKYKHDKIVCYINWLNYTLRYTWTLRANKFFLNDEATQQNVLGYRANAKWNRRFDLWGSLLTAVAHGLQTASLFRDTFQNV